MHKSSYKRMEWFEQTYLCQIDRNLTVLDVGSNDVNGCYRNIFSSTKYKYAGLDMCPGENVGIVANNPYSWSMLDNESFDVVISGQTFEHCEFFWLSFEEMLRVLKPGGYLCIIAPRLIRPHRFPIDAFRFDTDGMVALGRYGCLDICHASMNLAPPGASEEWYDFEQGDAFLVARKPENWAGIIDKQAYVFTLPDIDKLRTGFVEHSEQEHLYHRPQYVFKRPKNKKTLAYIEHQILVLVHSIFRRLDPLGSGWRQRIENDETEDAG